MISYNTLYIIIYNTHISHYSGKGPKNLLVDLVFCVGFCQNISFLSNKSCGFGGYLLPPFMEQACKIVFEPFPYVTTCKYHYYMKKKEIIGIYQLATRQ